MDVHDSSADGGGSDPAGTDATLAPKRSPDSTLAATAARKVTKLTSSHAPGEAGAADQAASGQDGQPHAAGASPPPGSHAGVSGVSDAAASAGSAPPLAAPQLAGAAAASELPAPPAPPPMGAEMAAEMAAPLGGAVLTPEMAQYVQGLQDQLLALKQQQFSQQAVPADPTPQASQPPGPPPLPPGALGYNPHGEGNLPSGEQLGFYFERNRGGQYYNTTHWRFEVVHNMGSSSATERVPHTEVGMVRVRDYIGDLVP